MFGPPKFMLGFGICLVVCYFCLGKGVGFEGFL